MLLLNPFRGRGHSRNRRHVFRAGPPLVLMRAAKHNRLDRQSAAQKKEPDAFWSVKFVRGEAGGIDQRKVDVDLAERLHHVAVKQNAFGAANL